MKCGTAMSITKNYFGLVMVLSKFLNQTCLRGRKFRTADLAVALKLVVKAEEYGLEVNKKLINGAFKFDNNQSAVPLYLFINSLDSNDEAVLYVKKKRDRGTDGKGKGRKTCTTIGVFSNVIRAVQVTDISQIGKWNPHRTLVTSLGN